MPVIRIEDIAHVRFAAPDLPAMRSFLEDFGLICFEENGRLYGKGRDGRPFVHVTELGAAKFLAVGLRAACVEDLELLAQETPARSLRRTRKDDGRAPLFLGALQICRRPRLRQLEDKGWWLSGVAHSEALALASLQKQKDF